MVQTWSTAQRGEVECPKCGARYRKRVTRFPMRDKDYFDCNSCGYRLDEWNDTEVPMYEQISGPTKESREPSEEPPPKNDEPAP